MLNASTINKTWKQCDCVPLRRTTRLTELWVIKINLTIQRGRCSRFLNRWFWVPPSPVRPSCPSCLQTSLTSHFLKLPTCFMGQNVTEKTQSGGEKMCKWIRTLTCCGWRIIKCSQFLLTCSSGKEPIQSVHTVGEVFKIICVWW